jgi:hypothetical protein
LLYLGRRDRVVFLPSHGMNCMTNSLFIRSYPAPGAQPLPAIYNSGAYAYFVVCLFPVAVTCAFAVAILDTRQKPSWLIPALVVSIVAFFLVLVFLRALRLEITTDGISYTNPVRGTKSLTYPEMSSVVLIDYRHEGNGAAGISRSLRTWTMVITPKMETGKAPLRIPLTIFPRDAYIELVRLLKPEVWESSAP